mmetsp:Transcript_122541/g.273668  ORF Transcript_122541/g.273668 Transcript_122541/m.273668 type:complete len:260 (+) Transcript_122541:696-1475(+)
MQGLRHLGALHLDLGVQRTLKRQLRLRVGLRRLRNAGLLSAKLWRPWRRGRRVVLCWQEDPLRLLLVPIGDEVQQRCKVHTLLLREEGTLRALSRRGLGRAAITALPALAGGGLRKAPLADAQHSLVAGAALRSRSIPPGSGARTTTSGRRDAQELLGDSLVYKAKAAEGRLLRVLVLVLPVLGKGPAHGQELVPRVAILATVALRWLRLIPDPKEQDRQEDTHDPDDVGRRAGRVRELRVRIHGCGRESKRRARSGYM